MRDECKISNKKETRTATKRTTERETNRCGKAKSKRNRNLQPVRWDPQVTLGAAIEFASAKRITQLATGDALHAASCQTRRCLALCWGGTPAAIFVKFVRSKDVAGRGQRAGNEAMGEWVQVECTAADKYFIHFHNFNKIEEIYSRRWQATKQQQKPAERKEEKKKKQARQIKKKENMENR